MLKRLKAKGLVRYQRYGKLQLSASGQRMALDMIRRHVLETFLYTHLNFGWDEIHEVAEELEHIRSGNIRELESFLGHPKTDPHGDAIPAADSSYKPAAKKTLRQMEVGARCRIVAVRDNSVAFLQYVNTLGLQLSSHLELLERRTFDESLLIRIDRKRKSTSAEICGERLCERGGLRSTSAMHLSSMAIGVGSALIATVVRQGLLFGKYWHRSD